ncbi:MAG: metal ABC transporter solute-binding protein, Zn/Mn family [Steroidobacteraceae bacterium]
MRNAYRLAILLLGVVVASAMALAQTSSPHVVLTTLQATYSITSALADGTTIRVVNVPSQGAVMDSQAFALTRVDDAIFKQAEAVVSIGKLWRDDPLYAAARARNLHIINIDAAYPWDPKEAGVSVIRKPVNTVPWGINKDEADPGLSRYVWLSPTNVTRMAELVAADLMRLSPVDKARVQANLNNFTTSMRQLSAEYGAKFAALPDPRLMSLADEFVYLMSDLGVFVDGWFIKQDVNWSDTDYTALTDYLKSHAIRVVVHKWQPDEKIAAAIAKAGAKLVVLDAGDPGAAAATGALLPLGYQSLMRKNMDLLLAAFPVND